MRQFFIIGIGLIIQFSAFAQNVDSLRHVYEKSEKEQDKVRLLLDIGRALETQSLDSALYYDKLALTHAEKTAIDTLMAKCYVNIGDAYLLKGNFDICLDYHLKARNIYQNYPDNTANLQVVNTLGLIYFYQDNYENALENFFKAEKLVVKLYKTDTTKIDRILGRIFNNVGIVYDNKQQNDLALEYYAKASTYSRKVNDLQNLPSIYSNMGIIYLKTKRYSMAETIFNEAFEIRENENDNYGLCKSYFHLGSLYNATGRLDSAESFLLKGLKYCDLANSATGKASVLSEIATTMASKGNYKSAYDYEIAFKALSDSLFKQETQEKMTQAEMQFNYEKEQQSVEARQKRKDLIYIIIATILFFGVVTTIVMFLLQKTKAKNQQLAKEKAEFEKESVELLNKELALRKRNLEYELEFKNKELTTNVMYLLKKNELIADISGRLVELKHQMKKDNQKTIQRIIMDLQTAQDEDVWEEFEVRFNQVYNDYYERLHDKFPNLSPSEKKLCAFLRLNMTSKEICALTRQSHNSLNVARARLRKKLDLHNTDTDLVAFLENI